MTSDLSALGAAIGALNGGDFYGCMCAYLRQCMHFDNVIVIVFQGSTVPSVLHREFDGPNVFRFVEKQYLPAAYLLDPIYHFHLDGGPSGIYRLLDVAPDNFRRSRYYNWYYGRIGITDEISVVLDLDGNTTITISMGKDGTSGEQFPARSEDGLRRHEPVVMALLKAHWARTRTSPAERNQELSITEELRAAMSVRHGIALSRRQAEVALLILRGHSSPSIGLVLGVSAQTVKVFRKQLYRKCNLSSQAELFALLMPVLEELTAPKIA